MAGRHIVETITIPIRAVATQTTRGFGVAVCHPWEGRGVVFFFPSRQKFTEAHQLAWAEQKAGRGISTLHGAVIQEHYESEDAAVRYLLSISESGE